MNYFHTHLCLDVTIKAATPLLNQLTAISDIVDLLKQVLIKKIKAYPTNQEQSSQPP